MKGANNNYLTLRNAVLLSVGITAFLSVFLFINIHFGNTPSFPAFYERGMMSRHSTRLLANISVKTFAQLLTSLCLSFYILRMRLKSGPKTIIMVIIAMASVLLYQMIPDILPSSPVFPNADRPFMKRPGISPPGMAPYRKIGDLSNSILIAIISYAISSVLYLMSVRKEMEIRQEELKTEVVKTRYASLKNQLNPHFLFNTLGTFDSMIALNKEGVRDYIQNLAKVLRYTLSEKEEFTVEEELNLLDNYYSLITMRFGKKVVLDIDIDECYLQHRLVPMALQLLVENAIKHNAFSEENPLEIFIKSDCDSCITVCNRIRSKSYSNNDSNGIGLANLSERYRLRWDKEIDIHSDVMNFIVTIPLISPEEPVNNKEHDRE